MNSVEVNIIGEYKVVWANTAREMTEKVNELIKEDCSHLDFLLPFQVERRD